MYLSFYCLLFKLLKCEIFWALYSVCGWVSWHACGCGWLWLFLCVSVCVCVCVCVYVCVCVWEREREAGKERERAHFPNYELCVCVCFCLYVCERERAFSKLWAVLCMHMCMDGWVGKCVCVLVRERNGHFSFILPFTVLCTPNSLSNDLIFSLACVLVRVNQLS